MPISPFQAITTLFKILSIYVLLALLADVGAQSIDMNSIERIKAKKQLIIAMFDDEVPPFYMKNSANQWTGFDIELATHLANTLGVEPVFLRSSATSYDRMLEEVIQKTADIAISNLARNLYRAEWLLLSRPYLSTPYAIIGSRRLNQQLESTHLISQLNQPNISVGFLGDSDFEQQARRVLPNTSLQAYPSENDLINALKSDTIDFIFLDVWNAENYTENHPEINILYQTILLDHMINTIGIVIHPDDRRLHDWINLYLETIESDGFLDNLKEKYDIH